MEKIKGHPLNMAIQIGKIRSIFPGSNIKFDQKHLVWIHNLTPSALSETYTVRLEYKLNNHPNVYIQSPKLTFFPGHLKLPHVYSTDKQWLCLYYRKAKEWNSTMFIADTVIPWTCEWILHYEIWACTGTWNGGGISHMPENKKLENDETTLS
ncbi:MAG: hypothetical protein M0Q38_17070 [Bacteroidales bacterium]|jgi:hypothetical protein|nr:hypothetical protein [Bacteroidales bacterium]